MSTYTRPTLNPESGVWEDATWHDDYFGPHYYGVEFPSNKKIYPPDALIKLDTLHMNDVLQALHIMKIDRVAFLNQVQTHFKDRIKEALE